MARARAKASGPQPIREAVARYLQASKLAQPLRQAEVEQAWLAAVGDEIGRHTRVLRVHNHCLVVGVDSAPWLQELSQFYRESILSSLQEQVHGTFIQDVEFRIQPFL